VTLLLALPHPYGFAQHVYPLQLLGSGLFILVIVGLNVRVGGLVQVIPTLSLSGGSDSDPARVAFPSA
jgi:hypothetical protein